MSIYLSSNSSDSYTGVRYRRSLSMVLCLVTHARRKMRSNPDPDFEALSHQREFVAESRAANRSDNVSQLEQSKSAQ